jgi:hypothetical protein
MTDPRVGVSAAQRRRKNEVVRFKHYGDTHPPGFIPAERIDANYLPKGSH